MSIKVKRGELVFPSPDDVRQLAMFSLRVENLFKTNKRVWDSLSAEDCNLFVEDVFNHYKRNGFPYPHYTNSELWDDFNALKGQYLHDITDNIIVGNNAGRKLPTIMMPHIWGVKSYGWRSPIETFESDKYLRITIQKVLQLSPSMSDSSIRSLLGMAQGAQKVSNFRPSVAKRLYDNYAGEGRVIDFSSGFGGRLTGAFASQQVHSYVGFEPASKTFNGLQKIISFLSQDKTLLLDNVRIHNLGSENNWKELHDKYLTNADLCFSSPPYFDTERYSDEETQSYMKFPSKHNWRDNFLVKVVENCMAALKSGGYLLLNIANVKRYPELEADAVAICKECGFVHEQTLWMVMSTLPGGKSTPEKVKTEPIFVFRKE